jgi:hypothetical protein
VTLPRAILCLLALVGLVLTVPANAGAPAGTPVLKGAKKKAGPYKRSLAVNVQERKNLFVKVKSRANSKQTATLLQGAVDMVKDFDIDWFKGKQDISHDVQTSGHEFMLRPNRPKIFRVRVTPVVGSPGPLCLYSNVQVTEPPTGTVGSFFKINGSPCEP